MRNRIDWRQPRLFLRTREGPRCGHRQGPVLIVDRRFVDGAHRAGLPVQVWTIDDATEMERLLDLGVDGIMTDRPTVLKDVLMRRGQWS